MKLTMSTFQRKKVKLNQTVGLQDNVILNSCLLLHI